MFDNHCAHRCDYFQQDGADAVSLSRSREYDDITALLLEGAALQVVWTRVYRRIAHAASSIYLSTFVVKSDDRKSRNIDITFPTNTTTWYITVTAFYV